MSDSGLPIGKVLIFCSASAGFCNLLTKKFGWCECTQHAGMNEVNLDKDRCLYNQGTCKGHDVLE